jgi:hypothetical protein
MRFSLKQLAQWASLQGRIPRSRRKTLSAVRCGSLQRLQLPVPIQRQDAIEVLVTLPLPSDRALPNLAKGAGRVSRQDSISRVAQYARR